MKNAACVTSYHQCPAINGPVPHTGGPVAPPGASLVKIGGLPAARVGDSAVCAGAVDEIKRGAPQVWIEGKLAARRGDGTVHAGVIMEGHPMVIIGGFMSGSKEELFQMAMDQIRASDFAKWPDGQEVLAKLEQLQKDGKFDFEALPPEETGHWYPETGQLHVNSNAQGNPDRIASSLVHEGSHAVDTDRDGPDAGPSIDKETRANQAQRDFYSEQRQAGYYDQEQERRRDAPSLRDDVRDRYKDKDYPEH